MNQPNKKIHRSDEKDDDPFIQHFASALSKRTSPPIRRNMFLLVARKTTGADSMERIESTIGPVNNNV